MTDTFDPPRPPSLDASAEETARTNEAAFGDGYVQTQPDGLNNIDQKVTLRWNDTLNLTELSEIRGFFKERKGAIPFFYTLPDEENPRKWRCKTWTRGYQLSPLGLYSLSAELVEDFSP